MTGHYVTPEMAAAKEVPMFLGILNPELADEIYTGALYGYEARAELGGDATVDEVEAYAVEGVWCEEGWLGVYAIDAAAEAARCDSDRLVSQATYDGLRRVLAYRDAGMTPRPEDEPMAQMLDNE